MQETHERGRVGFGGALGGARVSGCRGRAGPIAWVSAVAPESGCSEGVGRSLRLAAQKGREVRAAEGTPVYERFRALNGGEARFREAG